MVAVACEARVAVCFDRYAGGVLSAPVLTVECTASGVRARPHESGVSLGCWLPCAHIVVEVTGVVHGGCVAVNKIFNVSAAACRAAAAVCLESITVSV